MEWLSLDCKPLGLINETHVERFKFPNGECHVKIPRGYIHSNTKDVGILGRLNSSDDIITLMLLCDNVRRLGAQNISLYCPYLPFSRQDRVMVHGEPLSLKVFGNILNSLDLKKVVTYDVHSDVAGGIINSFENVPNHTEVKKFIEGCEKADDWVLICPDVGAYKKVYKLAEFLNYTGKIVTCNKIRDVNTGRIVHYEINGDLTNKDCIVVDDLIDGGATFLSLAHELKTRKNVNRKYLFCSHGIFSKGYGPISEQYDKIGTTNSIREANAYAYLDDEHNFKSNIQCFDIYPSPYMFRLT